MFTKKSRESKDGFWLSFYINGVAVGEYIPDDYNKYELWIRREYLYLLFRFSGYSMNNYYYWHVRYMLPPGSRKSEDLLFMTHVQIDHDGLPENKREKMFYKHLRKIYGLEYDTLIAPKIDLEKNGDVPTHDYALAYYKRWLRKPRPIMKQLYHGVDLFDLKYVLDEIDDIEKTGLKKAKRKMEYQKK